MTTLRSLSAALLGAASCSLAAAAQAPALDGEMVDAVAALILAVLPEEESPEEMSWHAVSVRTGSSPGLHWHLAEPDRYEGELSGPDAYRRTGWLETTGRQISVSACGTADVVTGLAFRFGDEDAGEALAAALAARGARVEQIGETVSLALEADADPDFGVDPAERSMRYAVALEERAPAAFGAAVSCTAVGSRAARTCRTNVSVTLTPDDPQAIGCVNPGRY